MYITRGNKKIELTAEEVLAAHKEFVVSWMANTACDMLVNEYNFSVSDGLCHMIAKKAYDVYSEGNGDTEYESVEKAVTDYVNSADCEHCKNSYFDDLNRLHCKKEDLKERCRPTYDLD